MVYADDIRKIILKLADECGAEATFGPSDVARAIDRENWSSLLEQVQLVADSLIQEGKIIATASGDLIGTAQPVEALRFSKPA